MNGEHTIEVRTRRVVYKLAVRRNITILRGDSGTGKTHLVELINQYNKFGKGSGVKLICDKPCITIDSPNWKRIIQDTEESIVFIDEDYEFIKTKEFSSCIKGTSNYYVLVSRLRLATLPYSINEIYGLRVSGKFNDTKQVYNEMYGLYGDKVVESTVIKPDIIVTEDKKSGYQFFAEVANRHALVCESALSKSNVINYIGKYSGDKVVLLIVDGAAFGPEMDQVMEKLALYPNYFLYTPESFEWLILKSGIIQHKDIKDIIENTSNHVYSEEYFSWERYFTAKLVEITTENNINGFRYAKKDLDNGFKSNKSIAYILRIMKNIEF